MFKTDHVGFRGQDKQHLRDLRAAAALLVGAADLRLSGLHVDAHPGKLLHQRVLHLLHFRHQPAEGRLYRGVPRVDRPLDRMERLHRMLLHAGREWPELKNISNQGGVVVKSIYSSFNTSSIIHHQN